MLRAVYPTDLTAAEWTPVELFLRTNGYGRPLLQAEQELLNAIFYQARAGCAWHLLPGCIVCQQFEA